MMFALPFAFTTPLVLGALIVLPAIWWLLRFTPPRPREISFPPTRLLFDVEKRNETPARSPWWLTLLRLVMATALIVALAGPIWRPLADTGAKAGPMWLLIDNGWAAAPTWRARQRAADSLIDEAEQDSRPVVLVGTADGSGHTLAPTSAGEARDRLRAMEPRSWPSHPGELISGLRKSAADNAPGAIVWLQDGLGGDRIDAFAKGLRALAGDATLALYSPRDLPHGLKGTHNDANALAATVMRADTAAAADIPVQALDLKGLIVAETTAHFDAGASEAQARFELPVELRNEIARLQITGEPTAGAVQLVDERWRRRTVGLLSGESSGAQPLLAPLYYLRRALSPYADLREPRSLDISAALPDLIEQNVSVMLMADIGNVPAETLDKLHAWVAAGGVLVRFAGPHMAANTDDLVPVKLRSGGRALGGSLSWEKPQPLASFSDNGPFSGLDVPDDVQVTRQVLAEPDATLPDKTWASLADGTPLVTAMAIDRGWVVLFHVTADTSWSNLPLSGTFVEMLRRILTFASAGPTGSGKTEKARSMLAPMRVLDGYGHFTAPSATTKPLASDAAQTTAAGPEHPPGLYGADNALRALNLLKDDATLARFDPAVIGGDVSLRTYETSGPVDLRAGLFIAALILLAVDALAVLVLGGGWHLWHRPVGAAALLLAAGFLLNVPSSPASAQQILAQSTRAGAQASPAAGANAGDKTAADEAWALNAVLTTRLAYVVTGNGQIDETSRAGLYGLSRYLAERTALEPGAPIGVHIDSDELAFFPLLYWPVDENAATPLPATIARVDAYMRSGGTILFDTRDQLDGTVSTGGLGTSPATMKLRDILSGLDIPALEPVPANHVLTKAFYLLETFPGRYEGSPLWVQATPQADGQGERPVRAGDGVSPILITANDFAAAWATNGQGNYLYPTVPGNPAQRDYAYRAGVNIVMYTLTGNYKADQVHVPALLERLGQ